MSLTIVRLRAHLLLAALHIADRFQRWAVRQAECDLRRIQQHMWRRRNAD